MVSRLPLRTAWAEEREQRRFELWSERDAAHRTDFVHVEPRDDVGERPPCVFRENLGILRMLGRIGQRFENADEIANGHTLLEQALQHTMQRAK